MVTIVANHRPGGNSNLLLLLWPTLMAAVYLSRRMVGMQVVAVAMVGAVVYRSAEAGIGVAVIQLLVMVASLSIAAGVVVLLRERLTDALHATEAISRTDPLTGLANRRGLDEQLSGVWNAALRRGETIVVLLLDVDHFKIVNDDHGHAVGDQVLAELATTVRSQLRGEDIIARFGGEEIVVVAADAAGAAAEIGERLRRGVATAGLAVPVTVSIGCVEHAPRRADEPHATLTALVARADLAMYQAKHAGRNRVVTVPRTPEPGSDVVYVAVEDEGVPAPA